MSYITLVTGASSGFGRMIADELAGRGHTVYASMRDIAGRNASNAAELTSYAAKHGVDLKPIELDVQDEVSVQTATDRIITDHGRLDVVVQNAGHMVFGPAEAFTPEQLTQLYDINVLGTQRVNRAVLPHMRAARQGLIVWIGSSSVMGGIPPLLAPYFAAKAGMDALAVAYARELAPLGIETSIVVPGAFTSGTNHFAHAGTPADTQRVQEYQSAYPAGFSDRMLEALAKTVPEDADPAEVAKSVGRIVDTPFGKRPFRMVIDPASDGAVVTSAVIDRIREQFLQRIGFEDLMTPAHLTPSK